MKLQNKRAKFLYIKIIYFYIYRDRMGLTYDQRVELLVKARDAKKQKMLASKSEPKEAVNQDSDSSIEEEPVKFPKTRVIPNPKWLKAKEPVKKVKDDGIMTKEIPVIDDETTDEPKPVKSVKTKKVETPEPDRGQTPEPKKRAPRKPKEAVRTLEIPAEPRAIDEVMDDIVKNDVKYKAKPKPKPSNPITISKPQTTMNLFDY
jgi:hypothetical protein